MKIEAKNWKEISSRLQEAISLFEKDSTALEKFYSIKKIIQGVDKKTDRLLDSCSHVVSRLEKLHQGKVIDIVIEDMPENSEKDKKRKKLLLLFLKYYRELKSEIKRLDREYKNMSSKSESISKTILKAKGPFGLITLTAAIILTGIFLLPKKDKQTPIVNIDQKIELSPKTLIKVIKYQDTFLPLDQLRIGIGPECRASGKEMNHYHAKSGSTATATDGTVLTDPGGCGFGKSDEAVVLEIEDDSNK